MKNDDLDDNLISPHEDLLVEHEDPVDLVDVTDDVEDEDEFLKDFELPEEDSEIKKIGILEEEDPQEKKISDKKT